jgi:adenine-specific DNA-methyltransferase
MAKNGNGKGTATKAKRVTRYTYETVMEPRTPETGHTALLPTDEQIVSVSMDDGWAKAIKIGKLPAEDQRPVIVDMDPAADPTLFWAGKRNRREVPLLPLQRNEIVSESRIAQIIARARKSALEKEPQLTFGSIFTDLEKTLRESDKDNRVEFYTHDEGWKNKLICGDSLHVIESLLNYEGLRGEVQMIFMDPPYGIKYDSNFQQRIDTAKNEDDDKADDVLTIKAFRDTWVLGVHSYLSYLAERLYLCRELLKDTGSVFVQISDENVHLVRTFMDEVFGRDNFCSLISFQKTTSQTAALLSTISDYLIWYAKDKSQVKFRTLYTRKTLGEEGSLEYTQVDMPDGTRRRATDAEIADPSLLPEGAKIFATDSIVSDGGSEEGSADINFPKEKIILKCGSNRHWKVGVQGVRKLWDMGRLVKREGLRIYKRYFDDFPYIPANNNWIGLRGEPSKSYVVQTSLRVVERCLHLTTDPGDLVFDPTCGSGTTAVAAERWGRRWITCDTSRVAVNVARQRLLSGVFEHFQTRNGAVSSGFVNDVATRVTQETLAKDLEPEKIQLVDKPAVVANAVRVCGPFEVMSIGRYSVEDWKGFVADPGGQGIEAPKLENYIQVICRLYRKDAGIQGASGFIHAVAESDSEKIAISVGPLSGRVTAKQIDDAVKDALASGILETHILGWAFESNVNEVKAQLEKRGKVRVELIMIRPDTLAEGLKVTKSETLFSPLAVPDIEIAAVKNAKEKKVVVHMKGVAVFDRKNRTTGYKHADSGYVSAWYLDEDYDGDCFVDCQMFYDFKKAPNLKSLGVDIQPEEFALQTESQPFSPGNYKRIAVKVVDVFGNESTVVRQL